jgi:hypothetical protein
MTTQKNILLGFSLVAAAIAAVGLVPPLGAAAPTSVPAGTWQISAAAGGSAWKLNTMTGELFYCSGITCDPARSSSD